MTYYTVQLEDSSISEFNKFQQKFRNDSRLQRAFYRVMAFVEDVGNNVKMPKSYFKFENDADRFNETGFMEVEDKRGFGLRLYCLPITDHIVVIFNGCEKTARTAQDCPNCSGHFNLANSISRKINRALFEKEINISRDGYDLEIDEDLAL